MSQNKAARLTGREVTQEGRAGRRGGCEDEGMHRVPELGVLRG